MILFAEARLDLGWNSRGVHHWRTGGKDSDALEGVVSAAVEDCHSPLTQKAQDFEVTPPSWLCPHRVICFTEGFTTLFSGPGPAIVNQSFPLPFNFSSRCNYCNALNLGATPEDHSEATAATHCGFPLARNCSPQATCHNNSFNTLYGFAFLMFKVALI